MRAGFGKFNITPRVGVELYGFGPFLNRNVTNLSSTFLTSLSNERAKGRP